MHAEEPALSRSEMLALLQAIQDLSCSRSLDEAMRIVRSAARQLTGAQGATFILREGDQVFYADEDAISPLWKGQRFAADRCVSGWAIRNRETVIIPDVFADSRVPADAYRPTFVKSLLMVPIRSEDPLGAIGAYWSEPHEADARERFLLETLANASACALANAELYRSLVQAKTLAEEAHKQEEQARATAESASRAKDEFLALLGHELRNPLSPILTALELLRMRGVKGIERECGIIERQAQHLVRLVNDLLDVTRITRGKLELHKEPTELGAIVKKAIETASPLLAKQQHHLQVAVPDEGLRLGADPARLTQVFSNLLQNAAKYTEPGGHILIEAERAGNAAILRVRDSGNGIPAELLPRIFDLFVQGGQSLARTQGGLGVGLSVARSLVALHGGTIDARSEGLGRGSEFTVRLPLLQTELARSGEEPPTVGQPGRSYRILMVDDNEDAVGMLAEFARSAGHEVTIAHDGPEALRAVQQFVPDLALLDIGLPVMDGYELARRLRQQQKLAGLRLVAVTAYGQDSDRQRAREAGFDQHIVKPLTVERFLSLLQEQGLAASELQRPR